jgi:hypothetical protein
MQPSLIEVAGKLLAKAIKLAEDNANLKDQLAQALAAPAASQAAIDAAIAEANQAKAALAADQAGDEALAAQITEALARLDNETQTPAELPAA